MLIGLVGLIGSGKNTVAERLVTHHGFKRDSFAKSLKDAVSSMFNCDREMLEGNTKKAENGENNLILFGVKNLTKI